MEALGAATNIVSLVQTVVTIISYIKSVKDAPRERKELLMELRNLVGLLESLQDLLEVDEPDHSDPWKGAVKQLEAHGGALSQFKHALEKLADKLYPTHGFRKIKQALLWKLTKPDLLEIFSRIERVKGLVQIALQEDATRLAAAMNMRMDHIVKTNEAILANTSDIRQQIDLQADDRMRMEFDSLLDWICSKADVAEHHYQYQAHFEKHHSDSGRWFFDEPKYHDWVSSDPNPWLFCPGIPGAGKSVLSSTVVRELQKRALPVAYLYCTYSGRSKQSARHFLTSMLRQLVHISGAPPQNIEDLRKRCEKNDKAPSLDEIENALRTIVTPRCKGWLVVDALDECDCNSRKDLLNSLHNLVSSSSLKILATSRFIPEIESWFSERNANVVEIRASGADIEAYVRSRQADFRSSIRIDAQQMDSVVAGVVAAASGL
ncbi:hypothetical protein BAUCODRAFT_123534 [Baudoinia panamericana UAMH 10762]|uniref:Nephrocystin 3-like N-terminal domain-containing protein n=1 Tax=Baudoinia panamericana (strain UAMH 10762) TaxID=717646 RepID=M2LLB1_BAUPA|nr:uncharacterized protein BAUCODRAFT_123534 [Baudoinia panamericana UAMH 10762]EMC95052.1 hypothetical protein BAUCODRAFT_123534 [Baudoinia panamericana UAMH 10762]